MPPSPVPLSLWFRICTSGITLLTLALHSPPAAHAAPRNVTLYNDRPRFDVNGQ